MHSGGKNYQKIASEEVKGEFVLITWSTNHFSTLPHSIQTQNWPLGHHYLIYLFFPQALSCIAKSHLCQVSRCLQITPLPWHGNWVVESMERKYVVLQLFGRNYWMLLKGGQLLTHVEQHQWLADIMCLRGEKILVGVKITCFIQWSWDDAFLRLTLKMACAWFPPLKANGFFSLDFGI